MIGYARECHPQGVDYGRALRSSETSVDFCRVYDGFWSIVEAGKKRRRRKGKRRNRPRRRRAVVVVLLLLLVERIGCSQLY
jgi:hypothetical protein